MTTADWRDDAACLDEDLDLFFPISRGGMTREKAEQIRDAKAVCKVCPVKAECLEFANETGAVGIWGGLTEQERGVIHRELTDRPPAVREPVPCGSLAAYKRHKRAKEPACPECLAAKAETSRSEYEKRVSA